MMHTRHPIEYAEFKEDADMEIVAKHPRPSISAQPTLIKAIFRAQPYKNESNIKKELDDLVVRMMGEDVQPHLLLKTRG